jgi:hypothetical protein
VCHLVKKLILKIKKKNLTFVVNVIFPFFDCFKSVSSGDVKNYKCSNCFFIINSCHVSKSKIIKKMKRVNLSWPAMSGEILIFFNFFFYPKVEDVQVFVRHNLELLKQNQLQSESFNFFKEKLLICRKWRRLHGRIFL